MNTPRIASKHRVTKETDIAIEVNLDGNGSFTGTSGIGFLDHMFTLLSVHSGLDITLKVTGDLEVDTHHTVEDIALVFGEVVLTALGDKKGIARYGTFYCPMDETLVRTVIDFSGRPYLVYDVDLTVPRLGTLDTEMVREFMYAFAMKAQCNLHISCLYGINNHHKVEAVFKALAHAIKEAITISSNQGVLSSKGVL